jgi:hypothetical protein
MERGRMESKAEQWDAAEVQFKLAVELCEKVYGKGSPESGERAAGCHA